MMTTLALPKTTTQALRELTGESRPDVALLLTLRDALAYQLARLEDKLQSFENKYGMPFAKYRQQWETEDREEDYQWEVEQDYLEWEALITRKERLEGVSLWLS